MFPILDIILYIAPPSHKDSFKLTMQCLLLVGSCIFTFIFFYKYASWEQQQSKMVRESKPIVNIINVIVVVYSANVIQSTVQFSSRSQQRFLA